MHVQPSHDGAHHTAHLVGTVTNVAASNGTTTLTVKLADGTSQSVAISSVTRIRPAGKSAADLSVGTKVKVVQKNGVATTVVATP